MSTQPAEADGSAPAPAPATRLARVWAALRGPAGALLLIAVVSTAMRLASLGQPASPIFDEIYYVNASRDIVGLHDPASQFVYHPGQDPNPEHPALGKLLIGGSMRLFGDTPAAWRLPSVVFGTVAVLLMYWLVRSAGGGPWMAVTGAALMAADNLFLVHSQIATLDIFAVVFMLAAAGLYLRRRWAWAGVALGAGLCTKLVAADIVIIMALVEAGRLLLRHRLPGSPDTAAVRQAAIRLGGFTAVAAGVYLVGLTGMDLFTTTYRNPIAHTLYMLRLDAVHTGLGPPGGRSSPLSAPWEWLYDRVPIPYFHQVIGSDTLFDFRGLVSPPIAYAVVPSMVVAAWALVRQPDELALVGLAWFIGTMVPFTAGALSGKSTYLYYMLVVLPGVYLAITRCAFRRPRAPAWLTAIYALALVVSLVGLYPLRSWSLLRPP